MDSGKAIMGVIVQENVFPREEIRERENIIKSKNL